MSDAGSEAESAPPAPNGHAVPVGPQHPLWQRAAGQGPPPPKRAKPRAGTTTVMGKFAPISMAALELRARNEFDGASSVGSEQNGVATSGDGSNGNTAKKRSRGADGPSRMPGTDNDDDFDPLDGGEGDEQDVRDYDETARSDADDRDDNDTDARSEAASGADVVANAAFGGGGGAGRAGRGKDNKRRSGAGRDKDCTTLSVTSDTDDGASITSSQRRNAHCRAFPVSGVDCVGCALPAKVTAVDDFVRASCDKMQEAALFKMAALIYQQKVAEPALAEDVPVPGWAWKDIRAHYTMHRMDPRMQRFENMRTLAAMRKTLELTLLREDEASGEHVLDKGNAEQIMKIITLQSKEITLLHEATNNASKNTGNQPPPGAASKKRD